MTMQQALTVVGTVVGAYFGYPQLGFVVGSLVGAALTPAQKVEGPRIDDQKVTVSTEGAGIPRFWGTARFGGNVVESTDKIEVATRESQGKGGGVKTTTYSYYVNMRTILAEAREGETYSIRKVWKDGKLLFDASAGSSLASVLASNESDVASLILYQGQEDQLPDPTEEARYGVGNVPAYRGVVSVVMNGVDCPGGRIPQFSYELVANGTVEITVEDLAAPPRGFHGIGTPGGQVWHYHLDQPDGSGTSDSLEVFYIDASVSTLVRNIPLSPTKPGAIHMFTPVPCTGAKSPTALRTQTNSDGLTSTIEAIDLVSGAPDLVYVYSKGATEYPLMSSQYASCAVDPLNDDCYVVLGGGEAWQQNEPVVIEENDSLRCAPLSGVTGPIGIYGGIVYALTDVAGVPVVERRNASTGAVIGTPIVGPAGINFDVTTSSMQADVDGVYVRLEAQILALSYSVVFHVGSEWVELLRAETAGVYSFGSSNFFYDGQVAVVGPAESGFRYQVVHKSVQPAAVLVATIIGDECQLAGLAPSQFDVSMLDEEVHGYTITNPASARAGIQPLMTVFAIDATDEDEQLRFFNRSDKTSLATISYDELGCVEDGEEPGDPMPLTRANVTELYRSVTASYINPEFDYQTSTEPARRQVTGATVESNVELPIALTSDQASTAAHRILYDNHNDRNRRSMKLSRKYACYSAGDVLTVEYPRGSLSDWRLVQVADTGALIEAEVVPADAELYAQMAVGGTGYEGQEVSPLPSPQRLQIGDIPILQDADNNAGVYAFMEPFSGAPGAELFVGADDASLESRGTVSNAATIGFVEGVIGDFSANIMDERNTAIVNIGEGELNSTTRALLYTSTVNAAAIGINGRWEIVQFLRASSLGGGRYLISGLLRGRRGTERNRGNHAAGDVFVLLSLAGTLRPAMDVGAIGSTRSYRAVSKGRSLSSAASQTYANTAEGLKPFSPWGARKTKAASDDQTLTWQRRTRMSSNALRGVVPLGEAAEAYSIDFYTSGAFSTLAGTRASTARTLTLTSAEQTAMGMTPGATLYVRIYQISESVGRGAPLEASI